MSLLRQQERVIEQGHSENTNNSQIRLVKVTKAYINASDEPWVEVKPVYRKRYIGADGADDFEDGAEIWDVPILYDSNQRYANWSPPTIGDTGLLIQTDIAFDDWWDSGDENIEPNNSRRRNRSDGLFLPAGWAKPKGMLNASDKWHESRNMENTLRIAMCSDEGVHLQDLLWHLVLSKTGFDVYGSQEISLLENLIKGFSALATEPILANKGIYADVAAKLAIIKGESKPPVREPAIKARP